MVVVLIQMMPLGLAAALSPVPIMTGITLSGSRRPMVSVGSYLVGGLLGYGILGAIGIAIIGASSVLGKGGHPSTLALRIELVIGALLLAGALFTLVTRRKGSGPPRWMTTVEGFGPGRAFLAGLVILSPHVKNLLLLTAAINVIGAANLGPEESAAALLFFMAVTLSPVLAPLIVHLIRPPERATALTGAWRSWLERNNQVILAIIFGVMGLKLAEQALVGLLS
jgi:hypothetical protein